MSLGEKIKDIRIKNGWTLEQFGDKIGELTTSNTPIKGNIANWEHNKSQPSPERLKAIASLGNVPVSELLLETASPSKTVQEQLQEINSKLDLILQNKEIK